MKLKQSNNHSIRRPVLEVHGGRDGGCRTREWWCGEGGFAMTLSKDFSASGAYFPPGRSGEARGASAWLESAYPEGGGVQSGDTQEHLSGARSSLKCMGRREGALHICLGELEAQSPFPRGSSWFIFIHLVLQV